MGPMQRKLIKIEREQRKAHKTALRVARPYLQKSHNLHLKWVKLYKSLAYCLEIDLEKKASKGEA